VLKRKTEGEKIRDKERNRERKKFIKNRLDKKKIKGTKMV
jgi:hypothetical protein